jgi:alcohol dehydrogenase class IV
MTNLVANWSYPTAIRFGTGRIAELAQACAAAGITRPLLVTDAGLAKLPIVEAALDILRQGGLTPGIFSSVRPNPVESNVTRGVHVFKAGEHDGVVAFGGGSGLDSGKLIAFMAGQTRPVWDFRTSATGGRARMPTRSPRSSPCRPPPAPAPRSAAPASSPTRRRTPRRSSSTRR